MEKKMAKAEFSFNDFLKMQSQMKMFGSMDQLLGMIPGLKLSKDDRQMISHEGEKQMKKIEVFIQSMTPEEREKHFAELQTRNKLNEKMTSFMNMFQHLGLYI